MQCTAFCMIIPPLTCHASGGTFLGWVESGDAFHLFTFYFIYFIGLFTFLQFAYLWRHIAVKFMANMGANPFKHNVVKGLARSWPHFPSSECARTNVFYTVCFIIKFFRLLSTPASGTYSRFWAFFDFDKSRFLIILCFSIISRSRPEVHEKNNSWKILSEWILSYQEGVQNLKGSFKNYSFHVPRGGIGW
jgi:hypothetical protein